MKKMKIVILSFALMCCILSSSLDASAGTLGCDKGAHPVLILYSRNLLYRVKTGEHIITDAYGLQSVCYIYTEYYHDRLLCNTCGVFVEETNSVPNVHGHTGCPQYR